MTPTRIMLADSNPAFVRSMQDTLQRNSGLDVVAVAFNGSDALKGALCFRPDVLITDLVMPVLDGFALMEALGKARLDARIIVLTELTRDCFIRQAMLLGACYYMIKPVDPAILISRVRDSQWYFPGTGATIDPIFDAHDPLSPLLTDIGITPGTVGYKYLHFAITLALKMDGLSGRITTQIYPAIARVFQTDQRNVERAIRHAISTAWSSDKAPACDRPTNGELIARLARQFASQNDAYDRP
jgi:two-component system response regulator (stage 0 sporulation protein A)